jgi:endonuclease-3
MQRRKMKNISIRKKRAGIIMRELDHIYGRKKMGTPLTYSRDIELLVAVILSAQSTDSGVNKLTERLFKKYRTVADYATGSARALAKDISSINYYKTKAAHIRRAARMMIRDHGGKVPGTMDKLLALPGVGRKTAGVVLGHLFGIYESIVVDTHVIRLSRKFGLTKHAAADTIERELMVLIPKKRWWDIAYKLKLYGREISPARRGYDDPISLKLINAGLLPRKIARIGGRRHTSLRKQSSTQIRRAGV